MTNRPVGNICNWSEIEQRKLQIELRTNQLIIGLRKGNISRRQVEKERDCTPDDLREYFREQLNKWINVYKGITNDHSRK
jgi:hypothetical protein